MSEPTLEEMLTDPKFAALLERTPSGRFIVAGPALLAAARTLVAKAEKVSPQFLADELAPLRAAIRKAEGRT